MPDMACDVDVSSVFFTRYPSPIRFEGLLNNHATGRAWEQLLALCISMYSSSAQSARGSTYEVP